MSNIDNQIASNYQPVLDQLTQQGKLASDRYAQNKADITNIFGKLSSLSAADAARINDQFVQTIADQQAGVAQRTAEVRNQQQTAQQGMQQVGTDRGNGPMSMGASPVDVAANQGVARSNEYQTTWEALMNANKMQAQQDASNANLSYGQQQNTAMTSLQRNLEDKLSQIGGNTAAVQSDIAKAKTAAQQNLMGLQYQAQSDAANRTSAQQVAKIRAGGQVGAAQINAAGKTVTKDINQWTTDVNKAVPGSSAQLTNEISRIYRALKSHVQYGKTVTKADLVAEFVHQHSIDPLAPYGVEYINKYFGAK